MIASTRSADGRNGCAHSTANVEMSNLGIRESVALFAKCAVVLVAAFGDVLAVLIGRLTQIRGRVPQQIGVVDSERPAGTFEALPQKARPKWLSRAADSVVKRFAPLGFDARSRLSHSLPDFPHPAERTWSRGTANACGSLC